MSGDKEINTQSMGGLPGTDSANLIKFSIKTSKPRPKRLMRNIKQWDDILNYGIKYLLTVNNSNTFITMIRYLDYRNSVWYELAIQGSRQLNSV